MAIPKLRGQWSVILTWALMGNSSRIYVISLNDVYSTCPRETLADTYWEPHTEIPCSTVYKSTECPSTVKWINKLCYIHKWNTKQQWTKWTTATLLWLNLKMLSVRERHRSILCDSFIQSAKSENINNILCWDMYICGKTIRKASKWVIRNTGFCLLLGKQGLEEEGGSQRGAHTYGFKDTGYILFF